MNCNSCNEVDESESLRNLLYSPANFFQRDAKLPLSLNEFKCDHIDKVSYDIDSFFSFSYNMNAIGAFAFYAQPSREHVIKADLHIPLKIEGSPIKVHSCLNWQFGEFGSSGSIKTYIVFPKEKAINFEKLQQCFMDDVFLVAAERVLTLNELSRIPASYIAAKCKGSSQSIVPLKFWLNSNCLEPLVHEMRKIIDGKEELRESFENFLFFFNMKASNN